MYFRTPANQVVIYHYTLRILYVPTDNTVGEDERNKNVSNIAHQKEHDDFRGNCSYAHAQHIALNHTRIQTFPIYNFIFKS